MHFHSRRTFTHAAPYLVISHLTWLFHILPGYFTPYLVISHLTWLFHTLPGYFTPYLVILHLTWLFHTLPDYFTSSARQWIPIGPARYRQWSCSKLFSTTTGPTSTRRRAGCSSACSTATPMVPSIFTSLPPSGSTCRSGRTALTGKVWSPDRVRDWDQV